MKKEYLGIEIETTKDKLLSVQANKLLKDYYCKKGETSPQMAFARAATAYCYGDLKLAQRIYNYVSNKWFMFASPVGIRIERNSTISGCDISRYDAYDPFLVFP